jgi:DNA-binding NtrC family response regulator
MEELAGAMTGKRILIVDDEVTILSVLKRSLEKLEAGYIVSTATDSRSALAQLGEARFDLVVTDYKMAGMDGLELLQEVRSLQPEARTILMTAYGSDRVRAEAHRLQTYRYMLKPFQIDEFC